MLADFAQRVEAAAQSLALLPGESPSVGLILGSGLGGFVEEVEGRQIPYSRIAGYPQPTVEGHRGLLKLGGGCAVLCGRLHYYEGASLDDVVLPVFLLRRLGAGTLIVTNAAGAVRRSFFPGELVLIRDHLNLMGVNPLRGPNPEGFGPRFPDMSEAYSRELRQAAQEAARRSGVSAGGLAEGVYAAFQGPTYETPAEVSMAERLGADLVGMSTVPEVIAANYLGMKVLGISCVTNMAAGLLPQPLAHAEVVETGRRAMPAFTRLLHAVLGRLGL
jgi:purine-nucleoside phosphorylase